MLFERQLRVAKNPHKKTEIELDMLYTYERCYQNSVFLKGWVCVLLQQNHLGSGTKRHIPGPHSELRQAGSRGRDLESDFPARCPDGSVPCESLRTMKLRMI